MNSFHRSFFIIISFFVLLFVSTSCEKPVDHQEETQPFEEEAPLIAYLDPIESIYYYAEEYETELRSDPHILEWGDDMGLYSGYNLAGDEMIHPVILIPTPQQELDALVADMFALFLEQIEFGSTDITILPAPSRTHIKMACRFVENSFETCENNTDGTSTHKKYEELSVCDKTSNKKNKCTEFYLRWYTEVIYNMKDCDDGEGNPTTAKEHKKWQCL